MKVIDKQLSYFLEVFVGIAAIQNKIGCISRCFKINFLGKRGNSDGSAVGLTKVFLVALEEKRFDLFGAIYRSPVITFFWIIIFVNWHFDSGKATFLTFTTSIRALAKHTGQIFALFEAFEVGFSSNFAC